MSLTTGTTFERIKQWNIYGCKPELDIHLDTEVLGDAINSQLDRIREELIETKKAFEEHNDKEILDGICDVDVTISGLFYMCNYVPDNVLKHSLNLFSDELNDPEKMVHDTMMETIDILLEACDEFFDELNYNVFYGNLIVLKNYARYKYNYDDAINAVLDNNDDKFYVGKELYDVAVARCAELLESTGDEHTVEVYYESVNDILELDDLSNDDLVVFSIHRTKDNKICKPANFVSVELDDFLNK
jgi:hypothetical protein